MICISPLRCSLAAIVVAAAVIVSRRIGMDPFFIAWIAVALAGIVFVTTWRNARTGVRALTLCAIGMAIGLAFCPATDPPHEPGDELRYMMVGVVLSWGIGTLIAHRDRPASDSADACLQTKPN